MPELLTATALDVRIERDWVAKGAVWIPLQELEIRLYELPPKGSEVKLYDFGEVSVQARDRLVEWNYVPRLIPAQQGEPGRFRLWKPNDAVAILAGLTPGKGLDLGAGVGRDSVFLADLGWSMVAVERLPDAIERGKLLEARYLEPSSPKIDWRMGDIGQPFENRAYDLMLSFFCFDAEAILASANALRPGAKVFIESFSESHRLRHRRPSSPGRAISREAIEGLSKRFDLTQQTVITEDRETIRLVGELKS